MIPQTHFTFYPLCVINVNCTLLANCYSQLEHYFQIWLILFVNDDGNFVDYDNYRYRLVIR